MNQTASINTNRNSGLGLLAWALTTLCVGIALGFLAVATVVSTSERRSLDPLPQLRWDDVR